MKMRWKPSHAEKFKFGSEEVTILKVLDKLSVSVILPNGKTAVVLLDALDLPIIDTQNYEKIT